MCYLWFCNKSWEEFHGIFRFCGQFKAIISKFCVVEDFLFIFQEFSILFDHFQLSINKTVMIEVFPFDHKTERNEWWVLLSSTVVNTSARIAGDTWFDSMWRGIILLFRSVVIPPRCCLADNWVIIIWEKEQREYKWRYDNSALAGKQQTALAHQSRVMGRCYDRSVPLRSSDGTKRMMSTPF